MIAFSWTFPADVREWLIFGQIENAGELFAGIVGQSDVLLPRCSASRSSEIEPASKTTSFNRN